MKRSLLLLALVCSLWVGEVYSARLDCSQCEANFNACNTTASNNLTSCQTAANSAHTSCYSLANQNYSSCTQTCGGDSFCEQSCGYLLQSHYLNCDGIRDDQISSCQSDYNSQSSSCYASREQCLQSCS
jgi:hypothetical protein